MQTLLRSANYLWNMSLKKFSADKIFDGNKWLPDHTVIITDELGFIKGIEISPEPAPDVQFMKGILIPGLINCHCHVELSHLKGKLAEHTGLVSFLIQVATGRYYPEDQVLGAAHAAMEEMYQHGIVAVGDISNTTDSIPAKLKSNIHCYNFIEALGFNPDRAFQSIDAALKVKEKFAKELPYQGNAIVPHAPYSISDFLFKVINDRADDQIISIHNQECTAEDDLYIQGNGDFFRLYETLGMQSEHFKPTGLSSLQSYLPALSKPSTLLLVHNTCSQVTDIDFAKKHADKLRQQLYFCLCPNANLYIENKLPPVQQLMQQQANIVLGTDSYSSNWSLDIVSEMHTLQKSFNLSLETLLQWATVNGADALQLSDNLGTIAIGKRPGLVALQNLDGNKLTKASKAIRLI